MESSTTSSVTSSIQTGSYVGITTKDSITCPSNIATYNDKPVQVRSYKIFQFQSCLQLPCDTEEKWVKTPTLMCVPQIQGLEITPSCLPGDILSGFEGEDIPVTAGEAPAKGSTKCMPTDQRYYGPRLNLDSTSVPPNDYFCSTNKLNENTALFKIPLHDFLDVKSTSSDDKVSQKTQLDSKLADHADVDLVAAAAASPNAALAAAAAAAEDFGFGIGSKIALKGGKTKKYCRDTGSAIHCDRNTIQKHEQFTVVDAGGGKIALKGGNEDYCSTGCFCNVAPISPMGRGGRKMKCRLNAIRDEKFGVTTSEFEVTKSGNGKIALKGSYFGLSPGQRYCRDTGDEIRCDRREIGPNEKFSVECLENCAVKCGPNDKVEAIWNPVSGIKYNVDGFSIEKGTTITNEETRSTTQGYNVGASVEVEFCAGFEVPGVGGASQCRSAAGSTEYLDEATKGTFTSSANGVSTTDNIPAHMKTYGGYPIAGWQLFEFSARITQPSDCYAAIGGNVAKLHGTAMQTDPGSSSVIRTIRGSSIRTFSPVVQGVVRKPICQHSGQHAGYGSFYLHCGTDPGWKPCQTCSVVAPEYGNLGDCDQVNGLESGSSCQPQCNDGWSVSGPSVCGCMRLEVGKPAPFAGIFNQDGVGSMPHNGFKSAHLGAGEMTTFAGWLCPSQNGGGVTFSGATCRRHEATAAAAAAAGSVARRRKKGWRV
jgi:hypothetical protein